MPKKGDKIRITNSIGSYNYDNGDIGVIVEAFGLTIINKEMYKVKLNKGNKANVYSEEFEIINENENLNRIL